jgi:hypothetical protein
VEAKTDYYAIIGVGRMADNPSGMARRRYTADGRVDETLRKDLTWGPTNAITDWEYGNLAGELVEISAGEADELIARFRERWSHDG